MVRRFATDVASPAEVGAVLRAFGAPEYWEDRFAEFGGGIELADLRVDDAGVIDVRTLQNVRREAMHPLLARLYPSALRVVGTERWVPVGKSAAGSIAVSVDGALGAGGATARLAAASGGSVLYVEGEVRVRVPLLGGPVERLVASRLSAHIPEIQRFTDDWVAAHG